MSKFNSPLGNKFRNFQKDSPTSSWEAFARKKDRVTPLGSKFAGLEKDSETAGWDAFLQKKAAITALGKKFTDFEKDSTASGYSVFNIKRKRKAAIVFWLVKLPLVIGLLLFAYYANVKRESPFVKNEKSLSNIALNKENNTTPADGYRSQDSEMGTKLPALVPKENGDAKSLSPSGFKNNGGKSISEKEFRENRMGKGAGLNTNNLQSSNTINTIPEIENIPHYGLLLQKKMDINRTFVSINAIGLSEIPTPFERANQLDFDPDFIYKKPSQWSLTIMAGANITTSKIKPKPGAEGITHKSYKHKTEEAQIPAIGYSFQAAAEYRYIENISLKIGLGYSKHRIDGTYTHGLDSVPLVDITGKIHYLPPNKDSLDIRTSNAGYTYSYFNIPIGLVYRLPLSPKWEGFTDLSAEVSVLLNASGNKLNEVYIDELENFSTNNLKKVNANLNLGLGISRKINKDFSVGFMVSGKSYLSPLNKNGYYSDKNTSYNLSLISTYNF